MIPKCKNYSSSNPSEKHWVEVGSATQLWNRKYAFKDGREGEKGRRGGGRFSGREADILVLSSVTKPPLHFRKCSMRRKITSEKGCCLVTEYKNDHSGNLGVLRYFVKWCQVRSLFPSLCLCSPGRIHELIHIILDHYIKWHCCPRNSRKVYISNICRCIELLLFVL